MTSPTITPTEFARALGLMALGADSIPVMEQYFAYTTGPADRWDTVAWRAYGDPALVSTLILANATIPVSPVLPQGVTVYCPLIKPPPAPAGTTPWSP